METRGAVWGWTDDWNEHFCSETVRAVIRSLGGKLKEKWSQGKREKAKNRVRKGSDCLLTEIFTCCPALFSLFMMLLLLQIAFVQCVPINVGQYLFLCILKHTGNAKSVLSQNNSNSSFYVNLCRNHFFFKWLWSTILFPLLYPKGLNLTFLVGHV